MKKPLSSKLPVALLEIRLVKTQVSDCADDCALVFGFLLGSTVRMDHNCFKCVIEIQV